MILVRVRLGLVMVMVRVRLGLVVVMVRVKYQSLGRVGVEQYATDST